jgi:hypothetical protein
MSEAPSGEAAPPRQYYAVFSGKAAGVYESEADAMAKDKRAIVRAFVDPRAATIYCMSGVYGPKADERDWVIYRADQLYKSVAYKEGGANVLLVLGLEKSEKPYSATHNGLYLGKAVLINPSGKHSSQDFESVCQNNEGIAPGSRGEMMGTLFKSLWYLLMLLYGEGAKEPAKHGGALAAGQNALISIAVKGCVAYLTCGKMNFWPFLTEVRKRVPYLPITINESAASAALLRMLCAPAEGGEKK